MHCGGTINGGHLDYLGFKPNTFCSGFSQNLQEKGFGDFPTSIYVEVGTLAILWNIQESRFDNSSLFWALPLLQRVLFKDT